MHVANWDSAAVRVGSLYCHALRKSTINGQQSIVGSWSLSNCSDSSPLITLLILKTYCFNGKRDHCQELLTNCSKKLQSPELTSFNASPRQESIVGSSNRSQVVQNWVFYNFTYIMSSKIFVFLRKVVNVENRWQDIRSDYENPN